jgi:small subunit ribosomal protein S2
MSTPAEKARFKKKEIALMEKERQKLESFYWGVQDMTKNPDAVFIIDTHLEDLAVREAIATRVKTVGITDTNADPTIIDYAIPANDDAVGSVKLILDQIIDAWIEGADEHKRGARLQAEGADKRGTEAQNADAKGEEQSAKSEAASEKKTAGKEKKEVTKTDKEAEKKVEQAQNVDAKAVKAKELTKAVKTPEKKVLEKAKEAKKNA